MTSFQCDTCLKKYKYKRNLTRHLAEKHLLSKYWECTEDGCNSKFIRRSYLYKHLQWNHGFTLTGARSKAFGAKTANAVYKPSADVYEDVSSDDDILDSFMLNFNLDLLCPPAENIWHSQDIRRENNFNVNNNLDCNRCDGTEYNDDLSDNICKSQSEANNNYRVTSDDVDNFDHESDKNDSNVCKENNIFYYGHNECIKESGNNVIVSENGMYKMEMGELYDFHEDKSVATEVYSYGFAINDDVVGMNANHVGQIKMHFRL